MCIQRVARAATAGDGSEPASCSAAASSANIANMISAWSESDCISVLPPRLGGRIVAVALFAVEADFGGGA